MIARANFAAQTQTHVAALDLMEARNHSDLARRLDAAAPAQPVAPARPADVRLGSVVVDLAGHRRVFGFAGRVMGDL